MTPEQPLSGDQPGPEDVAERYVLNQLTLARAALNRIRLVSILSLIVFFGYMTFMTVNFSRFLAPATAADMASGLISDRVTEQGPDIAAQIKQQIPATIAQIPDYVQQQLPTYRQALEDRFIADLTDNLQSTSVQVDKTMDDYLTAHKDEIKQALADGQNGTVVHQFGAQTTQQFLNSLKTTQVNGESLQSKLDNSLSALAAVQTKMDRLANATNLSPEEKKTRHAIAIMSRTINKQVPKIPLTTASALPGI